MARAPIALPRDRARVGILALVVALQALCVVFFVGDVAGDLAAGLTWHSGFEAVVACALLIGTILGAIQMRRALGQMERAARAQAAASAAFRDLIETRFEDWGLTPAEADVALFTLKGLDTAEIAALRGAAEGTVRAQLTRIYAKAGVAGRGQFVALFIEDLLAEPLDQGPVSAR